MKLLVLFLLALVSSMPCLAKGQTCSKPTPNCVACNSNDQCIQVGVSYSSRISIPKSCSNTIKPDCDML